MFKRFLFTLAIITVISSNSQEKKLTISIDNSQIINTNFLGNGIQWSAYPHADSETAEWGMLLNDKKWQKLYERVDFMQPQIIRVIDQANWRYFKGLDKNGKPILSFDNQEITTLYKVLDYCQTRKIDVIFGEWGEPFKIHDTYNTKDRLKGSNDKRWADMISQYVDFMVNRKGYSCLKYYNMVNEPNGNWASTDGNWAEWKEGLLNLHKNLEDKGLLKQIGIAAPDAVTTYDNPKSQYKGNDWLSESAKQLNSYLTAYDIHAYPGYDDVYSGKFEKWCSDAVKTISGTMKPMILGELGIKESYGTKKWKSNHQRAIADPYASDDDSNMDVYDFQYGLDMAIACIQAMNAGVSGIVAWDLDDAMHTSDDKGEKSRIKRWGMWNILGSELCNNPKDEEIRPWYYTWSLLCKYFPKNSQIIKIQHKTQKDFWCAYSKNSSDNETIVFVNNSNKAINIDITNINLSKQTEYQMFLYSEKLKPTDNKGFPIKHKTIDNINTSINLTSKSFTIITNYK